MDRGAGEAELHDPLRERLAELLHRQFCETLRSQGYRPGAVTSEAERTHGSLKPYAELPEHEKEQNRSSVGDIPRKLAAAGYRMVESPGQRTPDPFPPELLERLAEEEHDRWMRIKLRDGWRWGPSTDKPNRRHASLVAWRMTAPEELRRRFSAAEVSAIGPGELSESERDKDREVVRVIPRLLEQVGYTVVRG